MENSEFHPKSRWRASRVTCGLATCNKNVPTLCGNNTIVLSHALISGTKLGGGNEIQRGTDHQQRLWEKLSSCSWKKKQKKRVLNKDRFLLLIVFEVIFLQLLSFQWSTDDWRGKTITWKSKTQHNVLVCMSESMDSRSLTLWCPPGQMRYTV